MKTHDCPIHKTVIVGQSGVGKSTLMLSFINNSTPVNLKPTVAVQFLSKKIKVSNNNNIILSIWDTAGAQKYRSLVKNFYRGSSAVIIVFSIARFEKLFWYSQAKDNSLKNSIIYLIGTHSDKQSEREVPSSFIYQWASLKKIDLVQQISTLNLQHVNGVFQTLAQKLYLNKLLRLLEFDKKEQRKSISTISGEILEERKKKCCK